MNTSHELDQFAPAFLAAQKAAEDVAKSADNPFYKSQYADLPSVLAEAKKHLNANGIAFLQFPSPAPEGHLGLTTRLIHTSGQWVEDTAQTPLQKADPQGYGSAITYLRRYALQSVVGFAAVDDDGNAASSPKSVSGNSPARGPRREAPKDDDVPGSDTVGPVVKATAPKGFPKAGGAAPVKQAAAPTRQKGALFPKLGGKKDAIPDSGPPEADPEPNDDEDLKNQT